MLSRDECVRVNDCHCLKISDSGKAILVKLPTGEKHWIPVSQVHEDSEVWNEGDEGSLVLSEWICAQKGIEP